MRILKSIGLYFIYPFFAFLLGFFTHMGYQKYFYPNKYIPTEESYFMENDAYEVANLANPITTCDTRYIIVEFNALDNTKVEKEDKLPEKYWGMTRENLEESLIEYQEHPTLEDIEKGFLNMQLENFSQYEVKITKTYNPPQNQGYYLMVLDGKIVVMEEDKETIYLTTDIYAEALSDSLKQELIMGKFIKEMDELYGFLESYTS